MSQFPKPEIVGDNVDLPSQWLVNVVFENVEQSILRCIELGKKVFVDPRNMGDFGKLCVIQEPCWRSASPT
jgi:hypothetical protein